MAFLCGRVCEENAKRLQKVRLRVLRRSAWIPMVNFMSKRLALVTATAALALVAAAPALASAPFFTQAPSVALQGNELVGSYGGWSSYSGLNGAVDKYVSPFALAAHTVVCATDAPTGQTWEPLMGLDERNGAVRGVGRPGSRGGPPWPTGRGGVPG